MNKKRIAIDMDEVMTDAIGRFIELYQQEFNEDLSALRQPGNNLEKVVPPDRLAAVKSWPHRPDFFKDLDAIDGALQAVAQLHQHHEVFITTAAQEFEHSFTPKYNWIKQHLPFITWKNIVFCGDKSIIRADYLIDDLERNLKTFTGTGLLFTAPHNAHVEGYTRLNNWQEVVDYFLK
ncbi:5' nucleotidase, NT5C type [Adhaeribacter pallidiroseus]|uniref:Putative 5'(3')-deoxyribonucleotidase n=1 Tax=Adhaeribacter pallidiroseus TaxID=2072847 RepID=A0A369QSV8_9BACT|nr:5'-3'-deoxyribonucleotidase [Adhaeribacter pallidiroseus]RDC66297.1 putative 5'(3')-deoxyribonucleotidase [Adhaeribacter pallidiroseus]